MRKANQGSLKIKSSKLMNSLFMGNFKAAFAGRGLEFQDFREYTPGDDAKYIDWARSSGEGTTIMRRYREEKQGNILSVIDYKESLYFGEKNTKIHLIEEIVSLLGYASLASGEAFGGYILSEEKDTYIPIKKNQTSLLQLLDFKKYIPSIGTIIHLGGIIKNPLKKSIIFIISDSLEIDEKSFKIAALKHDIVYVHVSTHFENTLEGDGVSSLGTKLQKISINLSDIKKKRIYQEKRGEKLDLFARKLRKYSIDVVFIDDKKSIFAEFLKLMKKRET